MQLSSPTSSLPEPRSLVTQTVDIHCHCLPGLDDGPENMVAAISLCRQLVEEGIECVFATAHQLGRYDGAYSAQDIRNHTNLLRECLEKENIPLTLLPGAEVRVDERLRKMLADDEIVTLGDRRTHILLEPPPDVFIDLSPMIACLRRDGITAIVTHPERHAGVQRKTEYVKRWVDAGGLVQMTAGSLVGGFGPAAEHAAWRLLGLGLVTFLASDAHDCRQRAPCLKKAQEALVRRLGHKATENICVTNPRALLKEIGITVESSGRGEGP